MSAPIVGKMKIEVAMGDANKKGQILKRNRIIVDFGNGSNGTIYSEIDPAQYDIILMPKKK